jgi:hypothetical protein
MGMARLVRAGHILRSTGALISYGIGEWDRNRAASRADARRLRPGRVPQRDLHVGPTHDLGWPKPAATMTREERLARVPRLCLEGPPRNVEGQYSLPARYGAGDGGAGVCWRGGRCRCRRPRADDGIGWFADKDILRYFIDSLLHAIGARGRAGHRPAGPATTRCGAAGEAEAAVAVIDPPTSTAIAEAITDPSARGRGAWREIVRGAAERPRRSGRAWAAAAPDPEAWARRADRGVGGAAIGRTRPAYARVARRAEAISPAATRPAARDLPLADAWRWASEQRRRSR